MNVCGGNTTRSTTEKIGLLALALLVCCGCLFIVGCGTTTETTSTATTAGLDTVTAEKDFVLSMALDVMSFIELFPEEETLRDRDHRYDVVERLLAKWEQYSTPSERTEAALSAWLEALYLAESECVEGGLTQTADSPEEDQSLAQGEIILAAITELANDLGVNVAPLVMQPSTASTDARSATGTD